MEEKTLEEWEEVIKKATIEIREVRMALEEQMKHSHNNN